MNIITRAAQQIDIPAIAELFDLYRQFYAQAPNLKLGAHGSHYSEHKRRGSVAL